MYTDKEMAQLALKAKDMWREIEEISGENLIEMSGLLNFGDLKYRDGPEGNLASPIKVMKELGMEYRNLTRDQIETEYPFKNLRDDFFGVWAKDNGVMNVQKILAVLNNLARVNGARLLDRISILDIKNFKNEVRLMAKTKNGQSLLFR